VALSGAATATTTADASGNYSFAGLAAGSYTLTPSKSGYTFTPASQPVTITNANVASVNFTGQASSTTSPLGIDVTTSADMQSASKSIASAPFSTNAANELLLAFVQTDYLSGANTTVSNVTGGGLNWALVGRTNVQSGDSEIWRAFAPAPLSNITVTANLSQSVVSSLTVISFTGADTTGTNGSGPLARSGPRALPVELPARPK
jgi:Carboxypeptidase regulatory-like domain